ncbi:MAG: DUF1566 domain-containing protein, partial [Desulfobulbaceae bacterium]|nr:DUF1566 domain-containing protein [Desulfobulbaceae bacterium]
YSCGLEYNPPLPDDLGELVRFLNVTAGPDGPVVTFNQHDPRNSWQALAGYQRLRRPGYFFEFPGNVEFYNSGEDWYFLGNYHESEPRLPIHAVADGLVISSSRGYGNNMVLAHRTAAGLVFSVYSLLDERSLCSEGTIVRKGNVIAMIRGREGAFPYFHFEIAKQAMVVIDEMEEIRVPAHWYCLSDPEEITATYYNPTLFLLNYQNKRKWQFDIDDSTEGWLAFNSPRPAENERETVSGGRLRAKPGADFNLASYPLHIDAGTYNSVFVKMKSSGLAEEAKVCFTTSLSPRFSKNKTVPFVITGDGEFHEYKIVMADNPHWRETITGLRLEYTKREGVSDPQVEVDTISLGRTAVSPVPDSGQVKCYDSNQRISCPMPRQPFFGQDANYVINPPLYSGDNLMGIEVIKDERTGLQWHKKHVENPMNWEDAKRYCDDLQLADAGDWRLPTKQELQTIVNYGCMEFGLNPEERPECFAHPADENVCYWTATTMADVDPQAVKICFSSDKAEMADKKEIYYVLPVRGEPLRRGDYVDNRDGTVTDLATDLMWQGDEAKSMTWEDALKYCNNLRIGGYDDWRLPSVRELASLVDDSRHNPSIREDVFVGTRSAPYWSSTTNPKYNDFAWLIDFDSGFEYGGQKDRRYFVRPVRGASDGILFFSSDEVAPIDAVPPAHLDLGDEEDKDRAADEDEAEDEDEGLGEDAGEEEGWDSDRSDEDQPIDEGKAEKGDEDDGWGDWGDGGDEKEKADKPEKVKKSKKAKKSEKSDEDDGWGDWGDGGD